MLLENKVVIVTGGGSGIGEAAASLFAAQGAKVVIADWNLQEGERAAASINARFVPNHMVNGIRVMAVETDVSKEDEVRKLIEYTLGKFQQLDIVFNNAATLLPKKLEEVEEAEWDRLIGINLKSVYLMCKHSIAHLRKTKGTIVNMASLNGLIGQRQNAVYAATKGGIIAMTKALALDYAADGVRVNCICPAGVMTPMLETWVQEQDDPTATIQVLNDMHPLGRPATSEEIARTVLFLASGKSNFITGVALPVDGGASLGY